LRITAKRLRPTAQGCRFGYPGDHGELGGSTATRLRLRVTDASFIEQRQCCRVGRLSKRRNPFRVETDLLLLTQG